MEIKTKFEIGSKVKFRGETGKIINATVTAIKVVVEKPKDLVIKTYYTVDCGLWSVIKREYELYSYKWHNY